MTMFAVPQKAYQKLFLRSIDLKIRKASRKRPPRPAMSPESLAQIYATEILLESLLDRADSMRTIHTHAAKTNREIPIFLILFEDIMLSLSGKRTCAVCQVVEPVFLDILRY